MLRLGGGEGMQVVFAIESEAVRSQLRTYCPTAVRASSKSAALTARALSLPSKRSCRPDKHAKQMARGPLGVQQAVTS